jgi:exosortase/archaeosortase family protein
MQQKRVFKTILALFVIFLLILPFLVSFNDALTRLVEKFTLYTWMQNAIVPYEVKMVIVLTGVFGFHNITAYTDGFGVSGAYLQMTWNCIGWQSILLLLITFYVGLRGHRFTLESILEAVGIGILGTFLVNLLRLAFIVILYELSRPIYAITYHDYLAAIVTTIWLFYFWSFVYKYVLVEKEIPAKIN